MLFESLKQGFPVQSSVAFWLLWLSFAHHALPASHGNSTTFPILPHFALTSLSMHSLILYEQNPFKIGLLSIVGKIDPEEI